jgi:hypothetical protein
MQNLQPRQRTLSSQDRQAEIECIQEVMLLLNNLANREEATVKSILDRLYEVGSIRLIHQRVSVQALHGPLKAIARLSKPVFRVFALRWFKRNCPWLITNWLFNQVKFDQLHPKPEVEDSTFTPPVLVDVKPTQAALPPLVEKQAAEINSLRDRVGWLTAMVVILATLGCLNLLR